MRQGLFGVSLCNFSLVASGHWWPESLHHLDVIIFVPMIEHLHQIPTVKAIAANRAHNPVLRRGRRVEITFGRGFFLSVDRRACRFAASPKVQHRQVYFFQDLLQRLWVVGEEPAGSETASQ
jgi:hypothetical protein